MRSLRCRFLWVAALCFPLGHLPDAMGQASSRPGLGSIPYADGAGTGVTFRVWAPNASSVAVRGDFNNWGQTALTSEGASGLWSRDISGARAGQQYQYFLNGNTWKRDPRSRRVTNSAGNSIIYDRNAFDWGGTSTPLPFRNDIVIYQMHPGTFNAEDWVPSTFDENIERLDHIADLGVNAIQVMPISEFAADKSWGYNPSDLFAIESALGGPDAFKRFVKAAHQRGIAVFVDVVHNHYGPSDLALWRFDGWSQNGYGGIYFYNSTDGKPNTWWGDTRPDFGRSEVRQFIRDHIFMLVEEYRVGGFRWDSVFNIIYYNSGANHNPQGEAMLRDINWELSQNQSHVVRIAEDHAFDFNMNYESMWNVPFHDHIKWQVTQSSDAARNMFYLRDNLVANANHSRVHFSESHDSVGDLNGKQRLPRDIDSGNPTSVWARKRQLLAVGMVMTKPGIPMIFQGQEMNEDWTFSAETALRWSLATTHAGIVQAYSDLIHCRRNLRGGMQGLKGTGINVHHVDNANKVIAFIRWDAGGGTDDAIVVANFSATKFQSGTYSIQFPSAGTWYSHYNSDSTLYGADFDNIGSSSVVASGSPPAANVNMGMYSLQIFSKTPPPSAGIVSFDPPSPSGCLPVSVSFNPADGPLAGASSVTWMVGRNNWLDIAEIPLTWNGSAWTGVTSVATGTAQLNMVFHNGAPEPSRIYDNNLGRDWNLGISGCANLPSVATVSPAVPQGCIPIALTYEEGDGVLADTTNVFVHLGHNNWQDIATLPMSETSPGEWTVNYTIPASTWQLNFVFHDGATSNRVWDNNSGADWLVNVIGCIESATTGLTITNPVSDITVSNSVSQYAVKGTSAGLAGQLVWSNTLTGAGGALPVASAWSLPSAALAEGVNLFRVTGTNSTVNPNQSARDSATNTTYTTPNAWTNGQNGGTGWTDGWSLTTSGANAGFYIASTNDANNSLGQRAWGLWANSDSTANAIRKFPAALHVGDVFSLKFDNNWIDNDKSTGVAIQNRFGQNLVEFYFTGGGTNYLLNDAAGLLHTGIGWSDQGHTISFELTSPDTYRMLVGAREFTGTLLSSSEALARQVRIWNYSAGGGWEFNVYANDLALNGVALESRQYTSEISITRTTSPFSDSDNDGYLNWEEDIAGTNPLDAGSRFPLLQQITGTILEPTLHIPTTALGRLYDVHYSTNLPGNVWLPFGKNVPGSGGPISITVTNQYGTMFFRTEVRRAP